MIFYRRDEPVGLTMMSVDDPLFQDFVPPGRTGGFGDDVS
jgi:hypothetical protein